MQALVPWWSLGPCTLVLGLCMAASSEVVCRLALVPQWQAGCGLEAAGRCELEDVQRRLCVEPPEVRCMKALALACKRVPGWEVERCRSAWEEVCSSAEREKTSSKMVVTNTAMDCLCLSVEM